MNLHVTLFEMSLHYLSPDLILINYPTSIRPTWSQYGTQCVEPIGFLFNSHENLDVVQ